MVQTSGWKQENTILRDSANSNVVLSIVSTNKFMSNGLSSSYVPSCKFNGQLNIKQLKIIIKYNHDILHSYNK